MKCDAFTKALGKIDFTYKATDVIKDIATKSPNQQFTRETFSNYLANQGVSPYEVDLTTKGFPETFTAKQALDKVNYINPAKISKSNFSGAYKEITENFNQLGELNNYKETGFNIRADSTMQPEQHFTSPIPNNAILGWNRSHVQNIPEIGDTLVLDEFQSDWLQAERKGAQVFEKNSNTISKVLANAQEGQLTNEELEAMNNATGRLAILNRTVKNDAISKLYNTILNEFNTQEFTQASIDEVSRIFDATDVHGRRIVQNFPMKPDKFHQFMIVDAIDQAMQSGLQKIVIPIDRHGALAGSEGVTKFYNNLNKSILPDIRRKLEKQGLRIEVKKSNITLPSIIDNIEAGNLQDGQITYAFDTLDALPVRTRRELIASYQGDFHDANMEDQAFHILSFLSTLPADTLKEAGIADSKPVWELTIKEIPDKPVKWDIYSMLGALGIGANNGEES
ncbi:MAG: hypothetical protein RBT33_00865 [Candidatus Dojkabacteria bacterium]|nr:hypothetical protein [Candidatus Dojkabacteria bacterium]MDX9738904.1 hypothetical protein [Candidatus Dojkabacteria bacterium]